MTQPMTTVPTIWPVRHRRLGVPTPVPGPRPGPTAPSQLTRPLPQRVRGWGHSSPLGLGAQGKEEAVGLPTWSRPGTLVPHPC